MAMKEGLKLFLKTRNDDEERLIFTFGDDRQVWCPAFVEFFQYGKLRDFDANEVTETEEIISAIHSCIFSDLGFTTPIKTLTHIFKYYNGKGDAKEYLKDFQLSDDDPRLTDADCEEIYEKEVKELLESNGTDVKTVKKLLSGFATCKDIHDIEEFRVETVIHDDKVDLYSELMIDEQASWASFYDEWIYPEKDDESYEETVNDYVKDLYYHIVFDYYIGADGMKLLKLDSEIEAREAIIKGIESKDYKSAMIEFSKGIRSIDYRSEYIYDLTVKKLHL